MKPRAAEARDRRRRHYLEGRLLQAERRYDYARRRAAFWARLEFLLWVALAGAGIIALATKAHGATFEGEVPKYQSKPGCCAAESLSTAWDIVSVAIMEYGQQAPTWIAKSVVMNANPDSFAFYWPKVTAEAAPRQVASKGVEPVAPNARARFRIDVVTTRGRVYYAVSRNRSGHVSCDGNKVAIR